MIATGPFFSVLLNGVTSGTSPVVDCIALGARDLTLYLAGTGTISSGTLIVEEAGYNVTGLYGQTKIDPPGTWSAVTGANALDCTEVSGGKQKAYQLPPGAYAFVRVRVGTSIGGGGTIAAMLVGL